MSVPIISFTDGEAALDWMDLCAAIEEGHTRPKPKISDSLLHRGKDTLLSRAAWIDGMGIAVKSATVFPNNSSRGQPTIGGSVSLFDDTTGALEAILDFHLVTKWKTAGDSVYAATKLARPDSRKILIVGAGTVGRNLLQAYGAAFPSAQFTLWNRTRANAEALAAEHPGVRVSDDLEAAIGDADIITSATMSTEPFLRGSWLKPGQHVDLIGAYQPGMREADDDALRRARIFVDSFDTTLDHIGEMKIPLDTGTITREDVLADFYEPQTFTRLSENEITVFKNGGGAHLDLITSRYILDAWKGAV